MPPSLQTSTIEPWMLRALGTATPGGHGGFLQSADVFIAGYVFVVHHIFTSCPCDGVRQIRKHNLCNHFVVLQSDIKVCTESARVTLSVNIPDSTPLTRSRLL